MTDRPIIFSAPMVRALLAGRKTQTRRLASSPLARCAAEDRLYVREAWRTAEAYDDLRPSDLGGEEGIWWPADRASERHLGSKPGRLRPSIHMPRWASRLTLIVTAIFVEPLQSITERDAEAEGCVEDSADGLPVWYTPGANLPHTAAGAECYQHLWSSLHTKPGERWEDNPLVVVLSFRSRQGNIDQAAS